MEFLLDAIEARVLGSLIEKEIATPEYYPLSLNALVNACNQKSSREPVMHLDEIDVRQALCRLEELGLAGRIHDSRVTKFEHHARQLLDLRRPEIAVLCLLLLRGPQTVGELRNRSERLYTFEDIASVQAVLERMTRSGADLDARVAGKARAALATMLPRRTGEKESRYSHLLSGEPLFTDDPPEGAHPVTGITEWLEVEVKELRATLDDVLARLEKLEGAGSQRDS